MTPLSELGLSNPVLAAPMAGGPSTPALVVAAARAGSLGFVAGGYKSPEQLAEHVRTVRESTSVFGVNLFVPNPVPVDPAAFRRYAESLQPAADRYRIDLRQRQPVDDDDRWQDKVDLLLADPVPVVSFTFGIPERGIVAALRTAGTITVQTVTSVEEARSAAAVGVDVLVVQGGDAGGHSGTLAPQRPAAPVPLATLVAAIRDETALPIIAAGGLSSPGQVAAVMRAGAAAVMVGTVLLRADESGASAVHQRAIAEHSRGDTVLTCSFTGRPARALPNAFIAQHDADAPLGYPAIHHLTRELRQAAAAAGDPELVHLWAGTGYRDATAEPVSAILTRLAQEL